MRTPRWLKVQALFRANDPMYEIGMRLGVVHQMEDDHWHHTLKALAAHFGVEGQVQQQMMLVDPRVQWSEAKNIWRNAAIYSALYLLATPLRWVGRQLKR